MRIFLVSIFILLIPFKAYPARLYPESAYSKHWCTKNGGTQEYRILDRKGEGYTIADCVTDEYAIEVDFSDKWAECAGQSLYYADRLGLKPGCVLILEGGSGDERFYNRMLEFERRGIKTFLITPNDIK